LSRTPWKKARAAVERLFIGAYAGALLYLPVYPSLSQNMFLGMGERFSSGVWTFLLPRVALYFTSCRWLIVLLAAFGFLLLLIRPGQNGAALKSAAAQLAVIFFTPFLAAWITGQEGVMRLYVVLAPVFCLLLAIGTCALAQRASFLKGRSAWVAFFLFFYCNAAFAHGLSLIEQKIMADNLEGKRSINLFYNYYQHHYHPLALAKMIAQNDRLRGVPVVLYQYGGLDLEPYLQRFGIQYEAQDWSATTEQGFLTMLDHRQECLVITKFPVQFTEMMRLRRTGYAVTRLNKKVRYYNAMLVEEKGIPAET